MQLLERFQAKWVPVRVKKTRPNKKIEPRSDSIGTEKALAQAGDSRSRFNGRLVDVSGRLVHRLDHLDAAVMADAGDAGRQRGVGDEGLDLGKMRNTYRRAAAELCGVGDQHDAAGIGNDRLGCLHLAIVEVEQRALLVDRGR